MLSRFKQCTLIVSMLLAQAPPAIAVEPDPATNSSPQVIIDRTSNDNLAAPQFSAFDQQLLELLKNGNYPEAKKVIDSNLDSAQGKAKLELLSLLAYINVQLNETNSAISELQKLSQATGTDAETTRLRAAALTRMGDLYLKQRNKTNAMECFKSALTILSSQPQYASDPLYIDILDPIINIYLQDEDYAGARPFAERLVPICESRAAATRQLSDVAAQLWSYIHLSQIYVKTDPNLHAQLIVKVRPFMNQLLSLHSQLEGKTLQEDEAAFEMVQKAMLVSYVATNNPRTFSDYLWLVSQFHIRSLPLINWIPQGGQPKAVILCVHGFGLENRAFTAFGKKMSAKNFAVYAMDVRGFGAWQAECGLDTVNFAKALSDIRTVVKIVKSNHPGLPVFLLGESMGGAIVLQAATSFGENEIAGVISSVPSAERYQSKKMAMNVAFHLFKNANKPINVGKPIASQATSAPELREVWMRDPKARTEMSAAELLKFDKFMNETKSVCAQIKTTPVMVVQGLADKLVKPQGTYDIFDNVASPDKTMIIIGSAEHLIFETPSQSQVLLDGLGAWLDNHAARTSNEASGER